MFEHKSDPVISRRQFVRRLQIALFIMCVLIVVSVSIGVAGLMAFDHRSCGEAFMEACLILAEREVAEHPSTDAGQFFIGCYVLYGRFVFISLAAILGVPILHRVFHGLLYDPDEPGPTEN